MEILYKEPKSVVEQELKKPVDVYLLDDISGKLPVPRDGQGEDVDHRLE